MIKMVIFRQCLCKAITGIHAKCCLALLSIVASFGFILLSGIGCSKDPAPSQSSNPNGANEHPGTNKTDFSITDGEVQYDFGYVKPKKKYEIHFSVHNPTEQDIQIQRVRSECKCMFAPTPPKAISSKGKSSLKLVFDAPGKPQCYNKRLILQTTNSQSPLLSLRVKADVGRPLICQPEKIIVDTLRRDEPKTIFVKICNRDSSAVRPIYATSTIDGFVAQIPRSEIPPGGNLTIPVTIEPNAKMQDKGQAIVNIYTDSASQPQIGVPFQYSFAKISR